jgi:hypothetical protein
MSKQVIALMLLAAALTAGAVAGTAWAQKSEPAAAESAPAAQQSERLLLLWTSGDPEVAMNMGLMYTYGAQSHGWWDEVRVLVWGPSAKLLAQNKELQDRVKSMQEAGIKFEACIVCTNRYGPEVTNKLRELGVDVRKMGAPLTKMLKDGWRVISL